MKRGGLVVLKKLLRACRVVTAAAGFFVSMNNYAQEQVTLNLARPDAIVDLKTIEGVKQVNGVWRYSDVQIIKKPFNSPGPSATDKLAIYPTGPSKETFDIFPKAAAANFNDSDWEKIEPTNLEFRRGNGLLSFNWYRINVTIPEKIGTYLVSGSTVVFEIVVDDYSEIFVNGKQEKSIGQAGMGVVSGWNTINRVVLTEKAIPGEKIQIAVLGMNGPIGELPENYIWVRSATVDFYKEKPTISSWKKAGEIIKIDPALDNILYQDLVPEKIATGFQFTEGPVWNNDGYLLFSDPNMNVIYSYNPKNGNIEIAKTKSGYAGIDIGEYRQPGSNGLTFDKEGRLTICQHGARKIIRIEKKGPITVLADNYLGKKLNSPNDLVYRSDGTLFFTDPPYGLPGIFNDKRKEIPHSGVYAIIKDKVVLLTKDLKGPNGLAFSPDEKYLYVSNWDINDIHNTKIIMRYEVQPDGKLLNGIVFFNMNQTDGEEGLDGVKVDKEGNIYCSGPDGIWIISASGKYLGRIRTPEHAANMTWGEDGKTLFITATTSVYKLKTKIGGY